MKRVFPWGPGRLIWGTAIRGGTGGKPETDEQGGTKGVPPKHGPAPKSNQDFWDEALEFFLSWGDRLRPVGSTSDVYNDHSVIKLIAMTYWVGIFVPIVRKNLVERYGYKMVYIDTMGGSGVTTTRRMNDCFLGSCPAAMIAAEQRGNPFDGVIAVEVDGPRARALEERIRSVRSSTETRIFNEPLSAVASQIHDWFAERATSFAFIDPEGFQGMTWEGIFPVLSLKGDAMVTWFEADAHRLRGAALAGGPSAAADAARMDDLFGNDQWRSAKLAPQLTALFCERVASEAGKLEAREFEVEDRERGRYKLLLFAGSGCPAHLPDEWVKQMSRRLPPGIDIATLVDRKKGRATGLDQFL